MKQEEIKLRISNRMDDDLKIVRMGKKAREKLIVSCNSQLEIWTDPFLNSKIHKVEQAFIKDLKSLSNEKEIEDTVFVSKAAYDAINRNLKSSDIFFASKKKPTCVGSDPEFAMYIDDNIIATASELLPFDSKIGSDGPLGELRADPGTTPKEHVNNLEKLILKIPEVVENRIKCKIDTYIDGREANIRSYEESDKIGTTRPFLGSCGGHIHLGITKKLYKIKNISKMISELLDRTVAICINRLDIDLGKKRRDNTGYGKMGDFKTRYNNDQYRLEYRVLSGTWLLYKDLSETVLSVISGIVEEITERFSDYIDSTGESSELVNIISTEDKKNKIIKKLFPEIYDIYTKKSYSEISRMLTNKTNSSKYYEYIKYVLGNVSNLINTEELKSFKKITKCKSSMYEKLNRSFIENWTYGTSVFDHISK